MSHTRIGPAALTVLGLAFIGFGAAVKTGVIEIHRGGGVHEQPTPSPCGQAQAMSKCLPAKRAASR